jgi:hypothetical protein
MARKKRTMKLKLDANGNVVVQDGKPVYVKDDSTEVAFDVVGTTNTIANLNREAKTHREAKEAAEGKLRAFEGIADPAAALAALDTLSKLDQKKLIDAGEVDKVRSEVSKAYDVKLTAAETKAQQFEQQLYAEKVGGAFSRSKLIAEKLAIPPDMVEARFGKSFTIEDGKIVAKDANGNKLYSPANPGELANFDEALDLLVGAYPYKDQILKGSGASGGGAGQSNQGAGGKKTITRTAFEQLDPQARAGVFKDGTVVTD